MTAPPPGPPAAGSTYDVVLLAEQPLSTHDAPTKSRNPRGTEESKLVAPTALIKRNPPRVPLVDRAMPIKD